MIEQLKKLNELNKQAELEKEEKELGLANDLISDFVDFASKHEVPLNKSSFSYQPTIGIIATAPNLTKMLIGDMHVERDGLYAISDLSEEFKLHKYQAGYFCSDNYMAMVHPYFRRNLNSSAGFSPRFIDVFWAIDQIDVKKYIALDVNRVRVNVDDSSYLEEDSWYGAPFNKSIETIKNGSGKLCPPGDIEEEMRGYLFDDAYCFDYLWYEKDGIKTFQALDIKSTKVTLLIDGVPHFPSRYLHAEYDLRTGVFRHFDGAIQLFNEAEYFQRRDMDFNVNFKQSTQVKAKSKKLFKLNGNIAVKTWVDLCCHFLSKNPLVLEYFTGELPDNTKSIIHKLRAKVSK